MYKRRKKKVKRNESKKNEMFRESRDRKNKGKNSLKCKLKMDKENCSSIRMVKHMKRKKYKRYEERKDSNKDGCHVRRLDEK